MVGAAPASVSTPELPEFRNQLFFVASWSSKVRLPMVRGPSSVTVRSAGRLSNEKLAPFPLPSAITAAFQLAVLVQLPLLRLVHAPLAA